MFSLKNVLFLEKEKRKRKGKFLESQKNFHPKKLVLSYLSGFSCYLHHLLD
jgi:hypothetical protein